MFTVKSTEEQCLPLVSVLCHSGVVVFSCSQQSKQIQLKYFYGCPLWFINVLVLAEWCGLKSRLLCCSQLLPALSPLWPALTGLSWTPLRAGRRVCVHCESFMLLLLCVSAGTPPASCFPSAPQTKVQSLAKPITALVLSARTPLGSECPVSGGNRVSGCHNYVRHPGCPGDGHKTRPGQGQSQGTNCGKALNSSKTRLTGEAEARFTFTHYIHAGP